MYFRVDPLTGSKVELTKQEICGYERQWYDALKPYPLTPESHPLVTLGGASVDEVFFWDMAMLKLDFYSVHNYPEYNQYIYPTDIQQSITDGMSKFKDIMYWMGQVCPIPWIVGETGFAADDNTTEPYTDHLDTDPFHHLPPYMYGDEDQQKAFAVQSLADARNAGASGYSWWVFQNVYHYSHKTLPSDGYPKCMNEDFFGLLHYGDGGSIDWYDKKVVTDGIFQNYLLPAGQPTTGQPPAIVPLQQPANYFDPFNIHTQLNTAGTNAISGYVYNDKGNPIENAVVKGLNWLWTDDDFHFDSPFTFTDLNGHFELIPYNYSAPPFVNDPHRIVNIQITVVGAERDCEGSCSWPYGEVKMSQASFPGISLARVITGYDAIAENETLNSAETRNYYGWNKLTAKDLILNGNSNLTARNSVQAQSYFHAGFGSQVHIFTSDGFTDCSDFNQFLRLAKPSVNDEYSKENKLREIEVRFSTPHLLEAKIYPNPSKGEFTIEVSNPENDLVYLAIQSIIGQKLWASTTENSKVIAELDYLPKGIYLLHVDNKHEAITRKIIIQ